MWNGTSWTNLGSGMDFVVEALAHDGTNLYAGGSFTTAGGVAASLVAKWDGANWSPLGSGITGNLVRDILFSGTGTVGRTAVIDKKPVDWNIKEGVYVIKPIPQLMCIVNKIAGKNTRSLRVLPIFSEANIKNIP